MKHTSNCLLGCPRRMLSDAAGTGRTATGAPVRPFSVDVFLRVKFSHSPTDSSSSTPSTLPLRVPGLSRFGLPIYVR